jgi:hypothetical protein
MKNRIDVYINDPHQFVEIYLNGQLINSGTYHYFWTLDDSHGLLNSYRVQVNKIKTDINDPECEVITHTYKHS